MAAVLEKTLDLNSQSQHRQESPLFRAQRSGAQRSGARAQRSGARIAVTANPAHLRIKAIRFELGFSALYFTSAWQRHSSMRLLLLATQNKSSCFSPFSISAFPT
jgi:hypothetical protein